MAALYASAGKLRSYEVVVTQIACSHTRVTVTAVSSVDILFIRQYKAHTSIKLLRKDGTVIKLRSLLLHVTLVACCLPFSGQVFGQTASSGTADPDSFSVGNVWVKYVAGTQKAAPLAFGKLGCLKTTSGNLVFLQSDVGKLRRFGERFIHLLVPSWGKGPCGSEAALSVPYDEVGVLARGQSLGSGVTQKGPVDILSALAGFAGLGAAIDNAHGNNKSLILSAGVVAGTIGAYGLVSYANKRTSNYVSVFYGCDKTGERRHTDSELFRRDCQVVVFQVIDSHDYWNLSQFLSAKTGLEFVSEEAEKRAPVTPK